MIPKNPTSALRERMNTTFFVYALSMNPNTPRSTEIHRLMQLRIEKAKAAPWDAFDMYMAFCACERGEPDFCEVRLVAEVLGQIPPEGNHPKP